MLEVPLPCLAREWVGRSLHTFVGSVTRRSALWRVSTIGTARFRLVYWHEVYETATPSGTSNRCDLGTIRAERKETERARVDSRLRGNDGGMPRARVRAHTNFCWILLDSVDFCRIL